MYNDIFFTSIDENSSVNNLVAGKSGFARITSDSIMLGFDWPMYALEQNYVIAHLFGS